MEVSDFNRFFLPATQQWLWGESPYIGMGVYNPPWAWWLIGPVGYLPDTVAWWVWTLLSFGILLGALLLVRRPHPLLLLALLLTPPTLVHLSMGQWAIWLLLGAVLLERKQPLLQGSGLFLLALKPNLGWPFLLMSRPRSWLLPIGALLLSLLLLPRWPVDVWVSLRTEPPIGYANLLLLRSLLLGPLFLLLLAAGLTAFALYVAWRTKPGRRGLIAMLCCLALFYGSYHRVYDSVLLFQPILVLTERDPQAWLVILPLLWLPVLLVVFPWAVFIDWIVPLVILLMLGRSLLRPPAPAPLPAPI